MRIISLLAALVVMASLAPAAGATTVQIRPQGGVGNHGRASASVKAWKVHGRQVGVRLSAVTISGFLTDWTESHSVWAAIRLKCRSPHVKGSFGGREGDAIHVASVTVGVPLSLKIPALSARCLPPSRYTGLAFAGAVLQADFHQPRYLARVAGNGLDPGV